MSIKLVILSALGIGILLIGFGLFVIFFWIIGSSGNNNPPINNKIINDNGSDGNGDDHGDNGGNYFNGKFNIKATTDWDQISNTTLNFGSSRFSGDSKYFKYDTSQYTVTYVGEKGSAILIDFKIPKADLSDKNNIIIHYYTQKPGQPAKYITVENSSVANYQETVDVTNGTVMWLVNYSKTSFNKFSTDMSKDSYWSLTLSS